MDGSNVFGWFDLPYTLATDASRGPWDRVMSAINAVADRVDFRPFSGIAIMLNAPVDSGGFQGPATLTLNGATQSYGLVVLNNLAWGNTWAAQEMSHGFNLDHSWSADPDTEYGNPFDVMSAFTNNYGFASPRFAGSGPGFNAPNLDLFGWIPAARVWQGNNSDVITLTALNRPQNGGYLIVKMNSRGRDYTVELRCRDGWDRAIPQHAVVIHEVRAEAAHVTAADFDALALEHASEPPRTEGRMVQVQLVNAAHQSQIRLRNRLRLVVQARAAHIEQFTLAHDRHRATALDQRFALGLPNRPSAPDSRVEDWRVGVGRSLCSPLARSFVCECHSISSMPRFQPPPRQTERAEFPHSAFLHASRHGLWDLSCRRDFRHRPAHPVAVEQPQVGIKPLRTPSRPTEAPAFPGSHQMTPDLQFDPALDQLETPTGMSHGKVIHPAPQHRIDKFHHPRHRLRVIPPEDVLDRSH
jgi:hypothetical protein